MPIVLIPTAAVVALRAVDAPMDFGGGDGWAMSQDYAMHVLSRPTSMVWFASAAAAATVDPVTGFWALAIGGAAIFPLTQVLLRIAGRPTALAPENPLGGLAMQIAFTVPITLPLAGAAALHQRGWFYPACLVIVGAHYLPFVFLYGMRTFFGLAAALICAGFAIGVMAPGHVVLGGWVGGAILFVFAFGLLAAYRRERPESRQPMAR